MSVSPRRESARYEREALPAIRDKAASLAVAILRCNKQQIAKDVFRGTMLRFGAENRWARWLWFGGTNLHSESCKCEKSRTQQSLERSKTLKEIQINEQQINEGNVEKPELGAII